MNSREATGRTAGATVAETGRLGRLAAWRAHHQRVAIGSLQQLLTTWVTSLMTWLVIGIALALPAILYVILKNVEAVSGDWQGQPRMSLYLVATLDDGDAEAYRAELARRAEFVSVTYVSPLEALDQFQARSGFGDVLNSLPENPLPGLIEVVPVNAEVSQLRLLADSLAADERVEELIFDLAWIERLYALLAFSERLVMALSLVLGAGVVLVIGNTIRLAIENRRSEIEIVKLVGGTDAFVRRPFIYLGLWYGLGGALMATVLVQGSMLFLSYPVEVLAQSYRNALALTGLSFPEFLMLTGAGAMLGMLGAILAVGRHLRLIEPG